jgi:hypothetical protein
MACLNLGFLEQVCILIVVAMAFYKLWVLISPFLLQFLPEIVVGIIQIAIWLIIAIFCIKIIFELLGCAFGSGGLSHTTLPFRQ